MRAEVRPDLAQRLPSEIPAHERQRVDQLDETVGEHDQQRRRVLKPVTQLLEEPGFVEVDAHPAAILDGLLAQHVEEPLVLLVGHLEVTPGLDGVARVHRTAGVEAVRAELVREVDDRADLGDVETRRRKIDLDRERRRRGGCDRPVDRAVKVAAHAHPVEGSGRRAVEAHLHRLDAELLHPRAVFRREVMAVRLDLELGAARAHALDHREELRVQHRLAAREREVRDVAVHQLVDDREHLVGFELVGELPCPGPLSSMQCRQARLHSLVICHATYSGAARSSASADRRSRRRRRGVRRRFGHAVNPRRARVASSRR
jgi:hypothetical protein